MGSILELQEELQDATRECGSTRRIAFMSTVTSAALETDLSD